MIFELISTYSSSISIPWLYSTMMLARLLLMLVLPACGEREGVVTYEVASASPYVWPDTAARDDAAEGLVWTVPNTFVASANVARLCGADVDFVDIRASDYCMDAQALQAKLDAADRKPDILIPVHFAGQSADMKAIGAIAKAHDIRVIEDASHCIGGSYNGQPIGACEFSDICVFSFHPVKIGSRVDVSARPKVHSVLRIEFGHRNFSKQISPHRFVDLFQNPRVQKECRSCVEAESILFNRRATASHTIHAFNQPNFPALLRLKHGSREPSWPCSDDRYLIRHSSHFYKSHRVGNIPCCLLATTAN